NGIYKTTNAGLTWTKLAGGLPITLVGRVDLAVAPSMPSRVYAVFVNPSDAAGNGAGTQSAWRTDNGGTSWTSLPTGNFQPSYGCSLPVISAQPTNPDVVFTGGLNLIRSTNAGAAWTTVPPPHVDNHALAWDASGRLLAGEDGGIHRSTNLGT